MGLPATTSPSGGGHRGRGAAPGPELYGDRGMTGEQLRGRAALRHRETAREGHAPAAPAATHHRRVLTFVRAWDFPQRPQQVRGAEGAGRLRPCSVPWPFCQASAW